MTQRSPIVFWLLVAATIAVNAVAIAWSYAVSLPRSEQLHFGLWSGQISIVTIWAYFTRANRYVRWLTPPLFVVAAVLVTIWLYQSDPPWPVDSFDMGMAYLMVWAAQVACIALGSWIVRQSTFGQRWLASDCAVRWQFSMKHMLIVMTTLALLLVAARKATIIHQIWGPAVAWIVNNSVLAIAATMIRATRLHRVFRLAATCGVAAALATIFVVVSNGQTDNAWAVNVVQTLVLFLWLEIADITPLADVAEPADPLPSPRGRTRE